MKQVNTIFLMLCIALSSCSKIEPLNLFRGNELVQLELSSEKTILQDTKASWADINGSGNLTFNWEKTFTDSEETQNLVLIISDGQKTIPSWNSTEIAADTPGHTYTYLATTPYEENSSIAQFKTVNYYLRSSLIKGKYCFSMAGDAEMREDMEDLKHSFHIEMPNSFTQTKSQDPEFLKEYMYMYACSEYKGNKTPLKFNHIPATLRLIVTNTGSSATDLKELSISMSNLTSTGNDQIASSGATVSFDWESGEHDVSYDVECHSIVTTLFEGPDTTLETNEKYVAYSMVLPLSGKYALKDKLLNFRVKTSNSEYLAYQLNTEKLAKANGNGIYNWVGGKSYTIKIYLDDDSIARGWITTDHSIEIVSDIADTYTLRYEDGKGQLMDDYADICTLSVNEAACYEEFIAANSAPREAETIAIYNAAGVRISDFSISDFKQSTEEPIYSIGMLSDVHCEYYMKNEPINDFQNALSFLNERGVLMTCICGDITQSGTEEELALYKEILSTHSPTTPVYTTTGNHDCPSDGSLINAELWEEYTERPLVFEQSVRLPDGSVDHFLFLGMSYWELSAPYTDSHIDWLEEKFNEYRGERCFVITHPFFSDRSGNFKELYPGYNWLRGKQLNRLQAICDNNTNSFWFSGHSHWKWYLQKYEDRANIYRKYDYYGEPASGWCVHIPSCAFPTDSDGVSSRDGKPLESEGSIIHFYKDHIDIQGIDFKINKFLPIATYSLFTESFL